jgi:acyl-CoA synthetase (NDP forming)
MRVVGPNALGLINTSPDVRLNASLVTRMPDAGRVGFFCQSGALGSTILERFSERGLGLSTFVSAGNRADISGNDLLQYWEEDPSTDQVLLYLESIGNARKFARLVHRMAHVKPVAMVRTGGSGQAHPLGHAVASTGLMQRDVDQILAACGLIVVDNVDALIDVGRVATAQPLPASPGVAIVGNSDALAVLAVNALSRTRLHAAASPVTFARRESADAFESGVRAAMADPAVGSVLAIYVPAAELDADASIRAALRACAECGRDAGKPVVAVMRRDARLDDYGIPAFEDVEAAVHSLEALTWLAEWRVVDTRASAEVTTWHDHPGGTPTLEPGTIAGEPAARLLSEAGSSRVSIDPESPGTIGCRIRLVEDPLFGPVVIVSVDDPVAEALDDRACRLAPVTVVAARDMLSSVAARDVAVQADMDREAAFTALAQVISDVSRLHNLLPGVTSADLRHVNVRPGGVVVLGDVAIAVSDQAVVADPTARRL